MNRFRRAGVIFCFLAAPLVYAQTSIESDEQTLKIQNPPIEPKTLVEWFESRSAKEGDAKHLPMLVRKLGSEVYREREPAARELIKRGPAALPFLRPVVTSPPSLETKRRAEDCITKIEETMKADVIAAAARVLASRKDPKAAETLFNFLPSIAADPFLEEDVLSSVGRLTIAPDKVDSLILKGIKDELPGRRMAAAYLIGRRASADHRQALRQLLADSDARVRERVAEGLFGKRPFESLKENLAADEKLLRDNKIDPTEANLLKYFRDLTRSPEDQKRLRGMVKNLGSETYIVRERAHQQLKKDGTPALSFLREAEFDANLERAMRANQLMEHIRSSNNTALPIAAAHVLARPSKESPAEIVRTLLAYVPFADDDQVEEEMLTALTVLSLREPAVEPELVKALDDPSPARRSAAAFVLGHVGVKEQVAKVQPLLDDFNPVVRLRAAQGMLAAHSPAAVPSFVSLIQSAPAPYLPRVEETLNRLADNKGPAESIGESRDKAAKAWAKWLADNKGNLDLTNVSDRESYLGLVTICEYDNQVGNIQGQVWEGPKGGAKRWNFGGVIGAMDAHTLPNGHVLVAENSGNKITERDPKRLRAFMRGPSRRLELQ